ncbi:MAG: DnaJ domain-containing protein [Desulfobacterales bacterium]|jgi:DnaJ-class molecular chaperone
MARSYFAILEVPSGATPEEVRSAYRRLAKEFHPDHYEGGSEPFRQIQEAYAVLGDPVRRSAYEKSLADVVVKRTTGHALYSEPEPLIPEEGPVNIGEISPVRSFQTVSPSFDEIFDWVWDNFSGVDRPKSGRVRHLTLEVSLTREQAIRGGNAEVMVPVRAACPSCRGSGSVGYYECYRCAGQGAISGEVPVSIAFPPGLVQNHSVIIPLEQFGIRNLHLTVLFRPRDV